MSGLLGDGADAAFGTLGLSVAPGFSLLCCGVGLPGLEGAAGVGAGSGGAPAAPGSGLPTTPGGGFGATPVGPVFSEGAGADPEAPDLAAGAEGGAVDGAPFGATCFSRL